MLDHIRQQLDDQTIDPLTLQGVGYNYALNWHFACFIDGGRPRTISKHDYEVLFSALAEIERATGVRFSEFEL